MQQAVKRQLNKLSPNPITSVLSPTISLVPLNAIYSRDAKHFPTHRNARIIMGSSILKMLVGAQFASPALLDETTDNLDGMLVSDAAAPEHLIAGIASLLAWYIGGGHSVLSSIWQSITEHFFLYCTYYSKLLNFLSNLQDKINLSQKMFSQWLYSFDHIIHDYG